jgi:hypothetical protein
MTTRLGSLNTTQIPTIWRDHCRNARISLASCGFQFQALQSTPELFDDVARFHERIYRDQHAWDPVEDLTHEQCLDLFMDDNELDPAMQFLAFQDGNLCAVASLRTTADADQLDLGWIGAVNVPPEHSRPLHQALFGLCIDAVDHRGSSMRIEIDRVDPNANAVVDGLPVHWDEELVTVGTTITATEDNAVSG